MTVYSALYPSINDSLVAALSVANDILARVGGGDGEPIVLVVALIFFKVIRKICDF